MWSPIHLLSIFVLIVLPLAILLRERQDVRRHQRTMIGLLVVALVIAGNDSSFPAASCTR